MQSFTYIYVNLSLQHKDTKYLLCGAWFKILSEIQSPRFAFFFFSPILGIGRDFFYATEYYFLYYWISLLSGFQ